MTSISARKYVDLYGPTTGDQVRLGDTRLTGTPPHKIARHGIGRAFQNLALIDTSSVLDNVMLGRYSLTKGEFMAYGLRAPWTMKQERRHQERAAEICDYMGLAHRLHAVLEVGIQRPPVVVAQAQDAAAAEGQHPGGVGEDDPGRELLRGALVADGLALHESGRHPRQQRQPVAAGHVGRYDQVDAVARGCGIHRPYDHLDAVRERLEVAGEFGAGDGDDEAHDLDATRPCDGRAQYPRPWRCA